MMEWRGCRDAGTTPRRHSGAGRNPGRRAEVLSQPPVLKGGASLNELSFPPGGNGLDQPLDSGLRRNDGGMDSGLRRAATGLLGGLFQTPLYHLHPCRRALSPHTGLPVPK